MIKKAYWLAFLIVILFSINAKANSINTIDMDVYIDLKGNASITEMWYVNLTEGSEGYRTYSKLDGSEISDLIVSDESDRIYDIQDTWNSNNNFNDKAYKSALVLNENGSKLYFGISNYGIKKYTIKYDISNIVRNYSDKQGIYYNFLQMDMEVGKVIITIHSDIPFSLDNSRIWGLGYKGSCNFNNGGIVLSATNVQPTDRMVALVRFEDELFNPSITSDDSFDDIYDKALSNETAESMLMKFLLIIGAIILGIPLIAILLIKHIVNNFMIKNYSKGNHGKYFDFGKNGKKLPKNVDYWREIPAYKNINYAYWLCDEFYLIKPDKLIKGIIGAYLLKWFNDGIIKINNENNKCYIDVSTELVTKDDVEKAVYDILDKASGDNKLLEADELKKWSKKNHDTIYNLGSVINSYIITYLEEKGDLVRKDNDKTFNFLIKDSIKEEAIRVKGFIEYLSDFSLINKKEHINVKLLDEYLMFAELFGVADKVRDEFSKLYPDIKESKAIFNQKDLFNGIITNLSDACVSGAKTGYGGKIISSIFGGSGSLAGIGGGHDYSGDSSASGGGGSSFSSGGSSAGGSSGGGFK